MSRFPWLILIPVLVGALAAPARAPAQDDRTVRVGIFAVDPLMVMTDTGPEGFCVELIEEAARLEGWQLEWVPGTFDEQLEGLRNGTIDLVPAVARSTERQAYIDFNRESVLTIWSQVHVLPESSARTILDLDGRRVAVMKGDINGLNFRDYINRFGIVCEIVELPSLDEVLAHVAAGGADAGVAPNVFGYAHAADHGLVASPIIFSPFASHFGVPAGRNRDLLLACDALLVAWQADENSVYYAALHRWFGDRFERQTVPTWLLIILGTVVGVAILLVLWNRLLEARVQSQVRDLQTSQQRFKALFDNHFQLTGLLEPDGTLIETNASSLALVGADSADVIGKPFWDTPWWTHDPAMVRRLRDAVREAGAGAFVRFEATHLALDGDLRVIDFSLKPILDPDGQVEFLIPEGRDVTEQKRTETLYRTLFEAAGDAIFLMEGDNFVECNVKALEMFRCTREEILGMRPHEFSPPLQPDGSDSAARAREQIAAAMDGREQVFAWQHRRLDGAVFDAEVSLTGFTAGGLPYVQAIVRDVTERKQLEADLRQAQKMEAIGTLAGGIAHDFNNILSAILGFGELARLHAEGDEEQQHNLDQVLRAGERARELVQQILAFSRRTVENRRPIELAPMVEETMNMLRSTIPSTVDIRTEIRTSGPVVADPTGVHQVLMNLCTNAYQAMAGRAGRLTVTLKEAVLGADTVEGGTPGNYVVLEVEDDGPGMEEPVLAKIFEPYFTTKGTDRGTGLGLAVVHGIVEDHGGWIDVTSRPGQGSTFRIGLRRSDGMGAEPEPRGPARDARGDERILLVDDERDLVDLCVRGLGMHGYEVTGLTDPAEALARFRNDPEAWDAVVTDMTMPGLTGLSLATAMLEIRPDLPIILCTGYSDGVTRDSALSLGVGAFAMKPLAVAELSAEIRALLDRARV